jgi:tetratricopeptide (TPR) repeat protein
LLGPPIPPRRSSDLARFARPEAISHYWQALDLLERLPRTSERSCLHCDVLVSMYQLPGWRRADDVSEAQFLRHLDRATTGATEAGQMANLARLEAIRGAIHDDKTLFESAIARAETSGDKSAIAFCAVFYGNNLGAHGQFEASLEHFTRAVDVYRMQGDLLRQALIMSRGGRCFNARAGKLDRALVFAGRVREAAATYGAVAAGRNVGADSMMMSRSWSRCGRRPKG